MKTAKIVMIILFCLTITCSFNSVTTAEDNYTTDESQPEEYSPKCDSSTQVMYHYKGMECYYDYLNEICYCFDDKETYV